MFRNQKFTLLELLVVVAIIAILVSILMPSLGKARYTARAAVCASGQKQNIGALTVYFKNNNGKMPYRAEYAQPQYHRYSYSSTSGQWGNLGVLFEQQYLGSGETLFCPQVNVDQAGKKESYGYYVKDGKFDPEKVLPTVSITASRSSYIIYPYQTGKAAWEKLSYSSLDTNAVIIGDVLWKKNHVYEGKQSWNIAKVNMAVKHVKNSKASAYIGANNNFYNSWVKTGVLRDTLTEDF